MASIAVEMYRDMADMNGINVDMDHLKSGEVNLGTSIMAIKIKDGVILGADSRTTTGAFIANRVTDKLTHLHDQIWCLRSGSAADTQAVCDAAHQNLQLYAQQTGSPGVRVAAGLLQEICYANKEQLSAGLIVAGVSAKGGAKVYSIPLGGSVHEAEYAIGGSGSTYIYGYCDSYFRSGFTEEEGIQFVTGALKQATKWDGSSGGVIRMVILTPRGTERKLVLPPYAEQPASM